MTNAQHSLHSLNYLTTTLRQCYFYSLLCRGSPRDIIQNYHAHTHVKLNSFTYYTEMLTHTQVKSSHTSETRSQ